jgi:hypothetical protein
MGEVPGARIRTAAEKGCDFRILAAASESTTACKGLPDC